MSADWIEASVVMPVLNGELHIGRQLAALARQDTDIRWELIVADNGSSDRTIELVRRTVAASPTLAARTLVVDASGGRGAAHARNTGVARARGGFLLFCDSDDVVGELWIDHMVRALRECPLVGGRVEHRTLNPDLADSERPQFQACALPTLQGRPWISSCNLGCDRGLFDELNGFDESLTHAFEDVDLGLRAFGRGIEPRFVPDAVIQYRHNVRRGSEAVRHAWRAGRASAEVVVAHSLTSPTVVDTARTWSRMLKATARQLVRSASPLKSLGSIVYVTSEAAQLSRTRAYWRCASTYTRLPGGWRGVQARRGRAIRAAASRRQRR